MHLAILFFHSHRCLLWTAYSYYQIVVTLLGEITTPHLRPGKPFFATPLLPTTSFPRSWLALFPKIYGWHCKVPSREHWHSNESSLIKFPDKCIRSWTITALGKRRGSLFAFADDGIICTSSKRPHGKLTTKSATSRIYDSHFASVPSVCNKNSVRPHYENSLSLSSDSQKKKK